MDEPEGSALDGRRTRARRGLAPTRLGGAEGNRLVGAEAAPAPSGLRHARGARGVQKKLEQAVAEEAKRHPDTPVEVWAIDEHRIGLKPIIRRVWAPKGQRPIALGHHRYKWVSVTAVVQPISGETFWSISNGISKPFFAALLALFAREAGAGHERIIALGLDNAGWHTAPNLVVPEGLRLVYLPGYSPELQPVEPLWPVLDEPLANRYFATLADRERAVADRCRVLNGHQLIPDPSDWNLWQPTRLGGSRQREVGMVCHRFLSPGRGISPSPLPHTSNETMLRRSRKARSRTFDHHPLVRPEFDGAADHLSCAVRPRR